MRALLLVVLGSLPHAASWTTISQPRYGAQLEHIKNLYDNTWEHGAMPAQQTLGFLWTVPNDPTSHEGLGAGITWAWDPNLCTRILSRFTEDFFFIPSINCDNLKAAMTRGFASWSDNSVYVSFTDVTEECAKIGQLNENCPLAEIWITTIEGTGDTSGAGATQGLTENSRRQLQDSTTDSLVNDTLYIKLQENLGGATTSAAVALPKTLWSWDFRYTSGVRPSKDNVLETVGGTVAFNADLCWYLDSTFCYSFHSVKNQLPSLSAEEVAWIFRGALLLIWGIAAMYLLWQVCHVCARARSHHHANQCQAWSEALHEFSMLGCSLRVILLLAPPIFYLKIFVPCWNCYDFEAAATHEVGHILGLSHPDNVMTSLCTDPAMECGTTPGQNVYSPMFSSGMRLNASTCLKPWQDVEPYEPTLTDPDAVKLSIMKALTQHNPSVCLSEDDLEALNTLYPDCVGSISTPVCNKTPYNIGWLRLTVWLVVPSLICLLLLLCIFTYTQYHQNKKFEHILQRKLSAEDKIGEHKKQADKAEASAHRNKKEKEKVKKELEEHKKDVEKKIEKEVRRRSIVYEARLQELQAYQSTQKSLKADGTRETLGAVGVIRAAGRRRRPACARLAHDLLVRGARRRREEHAVPAARAHVQAGDARLPRGEPRRQHRHALERRGRARAPRELHHQFPPLVLGALGLVGGRRRGDWRLLGGRRVGGGAVRTAARPAEHPVQGAREPRARGPRARAAEGRVLVRLGGAQLVGRLGGRGRDLGHDQPGCGLNRAAGGP